MTQLRGKKRRILYALALAAFAAALLAAAQLALKPSPGRSPQGFAPAEYAPITSFDKPMEIDDTEAAGASGELEADPLELQVSAPYEDLSHESGEPAAIMNPAADFIERSKALRRQKALIEQERLLRTEKAKRALARKIIQRNREEGYEVILDEGFNVIYSAKIKSKGRRKDSGSANSGPAVRGAGVRGAGVRGAAARGERQNER